MFFGFLKGKAGLEIDGVNFKAGETIKGVATLKLKKDVTATKMSIFLIGQEKKRTRNSNGGYSTSTRKIFEDELLLSGEMVYPSGELMKYPFEFPIPESIKPADIEMDGVAGKLLDFAKSMTTGNRSYKWFLIVRLSIPRSIDITKKVQISVV